MNKKYHKRVASKATPSFREKSVPNDDLHLDNNGNHLNRLYNRATYLSEGEWNSGDCRSARDEIREIERSRQIKEEGGEW